MRGPRELGRTVMRDIVIRLIPQLRFLPRPLFASACTSADSRNLWRDRQGCPESTARRRIRCKLSSAAAPELDQLGTRKQIISKRTRRAMLDVRVTRWTALLIAAKLRRLLTPFPACHPANPRDDPLRVSACAQKYCCDCMPASASISAAGQNSEAIV